MNKNEFLRILKRNLRGLPNDEIEDALMYYKEYFDEETIDSEYDVLLKFPHPSQVASQILSDYAIKGVTSKSKSLKKGISSIWFILLAIIVSPIALPIAFPILITLAVGIFVSLILAFVFFVVIGSLIFSGITVFFSGFQCLFSDLSSSLLFLGFGSLLIGVSILLFIGCVFLFRKIFKIIVSGCSFVLEKIRKD